MGMRRARGFEPSEGIREVYRVPVDLSGGSVRLELVLPADRHLDHRSPERRDDGQGNHGQGVVVVVPPPEDGAPLRHTREHADRSGHRGGDRSHQHVPVLDVGQLMGRNARQLLRGQGLPGSRA